MIWVLFIIPGLIAAYVVFARPVLKALPALKRFYAEADTFWGKVWALFGRSATVVWSFVVAASSVAFDYVDPLAALLGAPDFKNQVMTLLKDNPQYLGYFAMLVSGVTIVARLRSIAKVAR
ncbi:MAG: hypothetical protein K5821_00510 [Nitrobacter sp.]|uniref:hypothetical protein n=1 Tax=Nitrobacter sp. TaxID=29420 RepID=UPI00260852C5|nr:hypothetical protein [Nitrobacter sp.]MCV0384906.1 hypothetical protein [Nitrobacter sp.]